MVSAGGGPALVGGAVAVPDDGLGAVGGVAVRDVQAAAGRGADHCGRAPGWRGGAGAARVEDVEERAV